MSGARSNLDPESGRALLEAVDLGSVAVDFVLPIVQPDTGRRQTRIERTLLGRLLDLTRPTIVAPADQVRRSCLALDDFTAAVEYLALHIDDPRLGEAVRPAATWSERLWASNSNATSILEELRRLNNLTAGYRRNLVLGRPLY